MISSTICNNSDCQKNCLNHEKCSWYSYSQSTQNCLQFSDCFSIKYESGFSSSHFTCPPNITEFKDIKTKKHIYSLIDWSPFIYKKTKPTPYCQDFCKIDSLCEFAMIFDGFCMLGKFPEHTQIDLTQEKSLISFLRIKSKFNIPDLIFE